MCGRGGGKEEGKNLMDLQGYTFRILFKIKQKYYKKTAFFRFFFLFFHVDIFWRMWVISVLNPDKGEVDRQKKSPKRTFVKIKILRTTGIEVSVINIYIRQLSRSCILLDFDIFHSKQLANAERENITKTQQKSSRWD